MPLEPQLCQPPVGLHEDTAGHELGVHSDGSRPHPASTHTVEPCCALSKLWTRTIHEHNKWLVHATKFWGNLLSSQSNWNNPHTVRMKRTHSRVVGGGEWWGSSEKPRKGNHEWVLESAKSRSDSQWTASQGSVSGVDARTSQRVKGTKILEFQSQSRFPGPSPAAHTLWLPLPDSCQILDYFFSV